MIGTLDQPLLTVRDIETSRDFYCRALGMHREKFGAARVTARGVDTLEGKLPRSGAIGAIDSYYFREPDLNPVGISACRATGEA